MATGHMPTNRGRLLIAQGNWDDTASTEIRVAGLQAQPAAWDTQAEVDDLNFLNEVITTAGATPEMTATTYARTALTRTNAAEDDTNNRVNFVAADVVFASLGGAINNTIFGWMYYGEGGATDATRPVYSIDWLATTVPTNGGPMTYDLADVYRLS